ncbi:AraC family transcriptional regulator [Paenibacillus ginsengarvi]|uniref:Helix-turn-helix domain-containing protein n=1 Tax=Paenibacillus ginsengarvi TaxID=400777 RepID=A0A3B0AXE1_9BACL|nr:helix-turn-helix domain-containing protein [Paenibacillus ginsengarvi]RKN65122.1 helix-turn-helix domain-containing protein [Paenibacillus ginsengarvi]
MFVRRIEELSREESGLHRNWFYRLLLSYLPVFIIIVTVLLLISFKAVSDLSRKEASKANEAFIRDVLQTIDKSLREIDQTLTREIFANRDIQQFIMEEGKIGFSSYEVALKLRQIREDHPLIESIYVVRDPERKGDVVLENSILKMEHFSDRSYLEELQKETRPYSWSGLRVYEGVSGRPVNVISLARKINLSPAGFIVANVSMERLQSLIEEMSASPLNYVSLFDAQGQKMVAAGLDPKDGFSRDDLTRLTSRYTSFEIRGGFKYIGLLGSLSAFTYGLIGAGLVSVIIGIIWIIFISRRNYRPMERILDRLKKTKEPKEGLRTNRLDEFKTIESAIVAMTEETSRFEKQAEESLIYTKRAIFLDLLAGKQPLLAEQFAGFRQGSGTDDGRKTTAVVVAEIDGYLAFCSRYSPEDQQLLKFVVEKSLGELAAELAVSIWMEWVDDRRLAIILQISGKASGLFSRLCEHAGKWMKSRLPFTATFGMGTEVETIYQVSFSYESALHCLKFKASLGKDRMIASHDLIRVKQGEMFNFNHVLIVQSFVQAFKRGEREWAEKCRALFEQIGSSVFTKDDLNNLINYTVFYMRRVMMELSADWLKKWEQEFMPNILDMMDSAETLEEVASGFTDLLNELWNQMELDRTRKSNHILLLEVRGFIKHHYGNPDLSLIYLNDKFGISGKYLSQLFKEEFGENFMDFLVRTRMENAKKLLRESDDPVQEIAGKVGYTTSIAFIRTFKKTVGSTPGDYRKSLAESNVPYR